MEIVSDLKAGIMSLRTMRRMRRTIRRKLIEYLRTYLLQPKETVQGKTAAALKDSLNRLNPVDDNNKLETVNLTSS